MTPEHQRLLENRTAKADWQTWGPYLSERQWGTVREDYSSDGDAWSYLSHADARSRAYRWGEDGLAGFSDSEQRLCVALALWNGNDPCLKERLFGLTNEQGNHGEDVKELYYYLDATPTHSYMKYLYKYPHAEFPYRRLREENRRRGRLEREFELLDTGIFDDDRYFDIFVEYAKGSPYDILMRITAHNRALVPSQLHVLPHVWFRNTWSWKRDSVKPKLSARGPGRVTVHHPAPLCYPRGGPASALEGYELYFDGPTELLFTENDTNAPLLFGAAAAERLYYKDAFHDYVVRGRQDVVNPARVGTKCTGHFLATVAAGGTFEVRLRLTRNATSAPFADFDPSFDQRLGEADAFYDYLQRGMSSPDARRVQRQALSNLIWSRQFYYLDVPEWQAGDPSQPPPPPERKHIRNEDWRHLNNADVLTMPDKWEYPYYCAWDSAFQAIAIALVDPEWAKRELVLFLREWYMHPNGAIPAYEWNFGDVNPPVFAWAAWRVYQIDRARHRGGEGDREFLERVFHKLTINFTWWVNRKDSAGRNVFQGGFLGMDNVGVFDRSAPLEAGGYLDQADATSWMAMFSLQLMRMALELAIGDHVYEDLATKFFEHFLSIAQAMNNMGDAGVGLWDSEDQFFYDHIVLPDGPIRKLKLRSMVGLIPLFAVEVLEPELKTMAPEFHRRLDWFLEYRPDLAALVSHWNEPGRGERRLLSLLRGSRMKALLHRLLDESEFLSDHGPRTLSRVYKGEPYIFPYRGRELRVEYRSAESDSGLFGGNSNWRGPVWMPVSYLLIESIQRFHHYYGDEFKIECPTRSGRLLTLLEVAEELSRRLTGAFLRAPDGRRTVFGDSPKLQGDAHFRDYLFFPEYMDGDTGRGVGAAHQGWTCLIAKLLQPKRAPTAAAGTSPRCPHNLA